MKKNFLHTLLVAAFLTLATGADAANITVSTNITTNTTWVNTNNYILYGDIVVVSGVTLTIEPGTVIRGDKTTLSRLVVAIGGKLVAQGTLEQPIIFTSNQPAGSRARGDWAGIAICGLAPINVKDGGGNCIQARLECGTNTDYDYGPPSCGAAVPDDSSGVISYVRIEYAGYICGGNLELNSLTMGGVGSRTKIDHVIVSYGQDDGFEWYGGTVNADHIISYGSRDDDFDTDFGFSGNVQYGLVVRVDTIADQGDRSNAFESDNDGASSYNDPYTKGVFSNVTVIGPAATTTSYVDAKYGWAARLRRNTGLNIFNSLFIGYKQGLQIEGVSTQTKATFDTLEFKNNIIAGTKETYYQTAFDSLYLLAQTSNTIIRGNANDTVNLHYAYGNPDLYDFRPNTGSPALSGASFTNPKLASFTPTSYRGAFSATNNWTACWAEFSPQDEDYTAGPINYTPNVNITQSGSLPAITLTADNISGATYVWSTGSTTNIATAAATGTYTVTVTSVRGCTKAQSITISTVGISEETAIEGIRLFPNPNNGTAILEISSTMSDETVIAVTDLTGRELMFINKELISGVNMIALNISEFADGLYFVNVKSGSENTVVRMVVNK